jgi:transcriptional regulator with XRE-family HTH domain
MPIGLFAERLKYLRRTHNLTQTELAHHLGLAQHGYISNLEAGRKAPSIELVVRIADLFGVTTDSLLRNTEVEEQQPIHLHFKQTEPLPSPSLFGQKLRYLRLKQNMLQAEAARQLNLARQGYVSNLETGRKEPSLELVVRVAVLFGVTTDYLLRDTIPVELS